MNEYRFIFSIIGRERRMRKAAVFKNGIIIIMILISFSWGGQNVQAQPGNELTADVAFMDDYGNLLVDYRPQTFQVENNRMAYNSPPELEGYTFATVNVLKLELDNEASYRVNYFYTQDDIPQGELPDPVPLNEMPTKRTTLEIEDVWISWTDESMKELSDSETRELDYFWETYRIPEPKALRGYHFNRIETGMKSLDGVKIPHFVYIYSREETEASAPSLIFYHLIENRSLRTIRREVRTQPTESNPETQPETNPETQAETKPETQPETKPETQPETKPETEPETRPETEPETKPETEPETKPEIQPETKPETESIPKPKTDSVNKPGKNPESSPESKAELKAEETPGVVGSASTKTLDEPSNMTKGTDNKNVAKKKDLKEYRVPGFLLILLIVGGGILMKKIKENG